MPLASQRPKFSHVSRARPPSPAGCALSRLFDRERYLASLPSKRRLGIVLSEHTDEDGATIFRQACVMGLEGIVSKRLSAPYRSGRSRDWLKVKNPDSPAMIRPVLR